MSQNIADRKGFRTVAGGSGTKISANSANKGFGPYPVIDTTALTAAATLDAGTNAGVNTISGSGALTMVMPLAANCAGGTYIFRSLSVHAHILTASQETGGTSAFFQSGSGPGTRGSRLTLGGGPGDSVWLGCDGLSFIVLGASGSITVNGG